MTLKCCLIKDNLQGVICAMCSPPKGSWQFVLLHTGTLRVELKFSLTMFPCRPPPTPSPSRRCENKGQFSSTSRLDLMEYLEHREMGQGKERSCKTPQRAAGMAACLCAACVCTRTRLFCSCERLHVRPRVRPSVPLRHLARLLSCPGIYCDVVMLFIFLHVTHAFSQGHMERARERGLAIKN